NSPRRMNRSPSTRVSTGMRVARRFHSRSCPKEACMQPKSPNPHRFGRVTLTVCAVLVSLVVATPAFAKSLCVFDVSGANGDSYAAMKEFQAEAAGWGVDFELKPYTNEKTAADDFKTGKCDAVLVTGTRA